MAHAADVRALIHVVREVHVSPAVRGYAIALVTATVLWCDLTSPLIWPALLVTTGYGLLGFVDDYIKIVKKNKKGVPGRIKLLVQFVIGAAAIAWLFWGGGWAPELRWRPWQVTTTVTILDSTLSSKMDWGVSRT